jgi:L-alanine-DL-glutamate epimerase-like enolase superfamily enzyme
VTDARAVIEPNATRSRPSRILSRSPERHERQYQREQEGGMRIETVEGLLAGSPVEGTSYLVRITTDDGLTGIGQSAAWGYPEACASVVETFKRVRLGLEYVNAAAQFFRCAEEHGMALIQYATHRCFTAI